MVIILSTAGGRGQGVAREYIDNPGLSLANQKYMRPLYWRYSDLVHVDP
jgi:hypothetical protein